MEYNIWFVLLLGMGTVFFGLLMLIGLTKLMSFLININKKNKNNDLDEAANPAKNTHAMMQPAYAANAAISDRKLFDAVVSSAIAEYIGDHISGIRINSVRQLNETSQPFDRGQFAAAVSAAVATAMGEQVKGIRIKSIKKI